jgi:hypothetical protein
MADERPDAVDRAVTAEHWRAGSTTGFLSGSIAHTLAQPDRLHRTNQAGWALFL